MPDELFGARLYVSKACPKGTLYLVPKLDEPAYVGETFEQWCARVIAMYPGRFAVIRGLGTDG